MKTDIKVSDCLAGVLSISNIVPIDFLQNMLNFQGKTPQQMLAVLMSWAEVFGLLAAQLADCLVGLLVGLSRAGHGNMLMGKQSKTYRQTH